MRVTAVVVAWRAERDIADCLAAIDAQDHADLDIVVVDNASDDGTLAGIARFLAGRPRHEVRLVRNATNRGFAGGVNDALAVSDADAVLLVNPDARCAPDLVTRALAVLAARPEVGSVQPRLLRPPGAPPATDGATVPLIDTTGHVLTRPRLVRNRGEGRADDGTVAAGEVFGASGALVLHRRAMLDDVAWSHPDGRREHLTEALFAYFEDVELDYRARSRGWTAWYEPGAVGTHVRAGGSRSRSTRVEALNWSNRLLVVLGMEAPSRLARVLVPLVVTTALVTVELALTRPMALIAGLARLRHLGPALRRGRLTRARARVPMGAVSDRWAVPLDVGDWVGTWWRRMRPRGL